MEPTVVKVQGKFNETEEAILEFLYTHPNGWGTYSLTRELRPEPKTGLSEEQKLKAFDEIQHAIETLVAAKVAKGKRLRDASGRVYFEKLQLTANGEAEAIKQRRRVKQIVGHFARPRRSDSTS